MATYYGSYVSSAFRSRADVTTSQTDTDFTISVTGYCQMADYYHDSGENFFRKIVIGATPNTYVTASTAYFSGGGTYGVGSSSRTYNRTHSAQSIEVGVAIHNDGVYTGWSTADSYAKTTVTVPAKPSYAVTYNANGGSGAPSGQTKWYGETLTLSSTKPTRTGYTFKNWNTKSDGSGTSYAAGASYTANAALALYAQWAINTWTVSYNANGGSSTPASQTKTYNVALTLRGAISRSNASATGYKVTYDANGGSCSTSSATAARTTKYTFNKWNTKSDGSGTAYAAGASYTGNAALTLYATWTSSTTTSAVTLPTPSRTGYAFDGWYTAASGGTRVGGAGGSYTPTGAVTLHAHWAQNTWTVSYAANGGSSTPASQTKLYGQALTLRGAISRSNATATYTVSYSANYSGGTNPSSGTATKTTKYSFNGWKATNGTMYAAGGSYTANAATTMTAQWTSSASTTSVTLPTPARTGYTFGGWYKESACTNKVGNGGASYTPTASIQLFAKWTINTWAVAYNANGGTGAPASQTKTYGQTLTLSSTRPTRSGYTFLGWSTNATGTGTAYAPGGSYTANAAATLYAVWVAVQVTSLSAYRSDSAGTRSDSGTYGHLSAGWKALGTIAGTVAVTATANDASVTSSLSNRSGSKTATADLSNTSTGTFGGSYAQDVAVRVSVTATLTVSYGGTSRSVSATRVATIPKVFRLLDALHGGTGLAIGAIATLANTFEVALTTLFQNVVEVVQSNITRDGTYTEPANGDHQIRFVDGSRRILSYLSAHKTANSPNNYLRLTAYGPSGSKTANLYISASDTEGYLSTDVDVMMLKSLKAMARGISYIQGANGNAALYAPKSTTNQYYPAVCLDTNGGGSWSIGNYDDEALCFVYATKANRDSNTNTVSVMKLNSGAGTIYTTTHKPTPADIGAQAAGSYVTRNVDSAWINNSGGTAQLWNVGAVVKNANNKTYSGHSASLIVQNGGISLYDGTTSTWVWDAYTTLNKPTPAAIGAQPAGSYATTNASGAINTLASTSTQQWYVKGTVSNSSNTARNGHTTWLVMNNGSCSCWDVEASATLWNAYTTSNKPTPADIGAIDDITTSSKTVSLPANSSSVSVTAPSVSGYTFVCWLQPAGSGHTNPAFMQDPKSSTTNLWSAVGTTTGARNWLVTALYKK